ncbi:MAG: magnesium transporter CorA family protein [Clostridia bacterium]|nr:magnesium transporter CorA family protein [Clostridia bacterium]
MIKYFKSTNGVLFEKEEYEEGCWVTAVAPGSAEIAMLIDQFSIPEQFVRSSLDEEERSRIDVEDDCTLIIVDTPVCTSSDSGNEYSTLPFGIIVTQKGIVTVSLRETALCNSFISGNIKGVSTKKYRRFVLKLLYQNATLFLTYLRQAEKEGAFAEKALKKSTGNNELLRILHIEKGLVYFSTGLKGDEAVLEKLLRMKFICDYPEDAELLEDVIVENRQAIEMCAIYRDILSRTMEAYSGVISNNLNSVMKLLAAITIILTVPQIVFALWGINTPIPFEYSPLGFWLVIGVAAVATAIATAFAFFKKWL